MEAQTVEEEKPSKSEATRERILAAGLALFAEKGFAAATMREIAATADCSPGLAYRYFATKDAMVLDLYAQLVAEFAEEASALKGGPLSQRWGRATRGDLDRLAPHRGALMGLAGAGLAPGRPTQVLGEDALPARLQMLTLFHGLVTGAKDAPKPKLAAALGTLFYALHLLLVFFWLQDPSPDQRTTHKLVEFGEDLLDRIRPLLRLRWVSNALIRLANILTPILDGTEGGE